MALFSYTLGCKECGHTWKQVMEKGSRPPRCPQCAGQTQHGLTAPAISTGEAKPSITIPQRQSQREQLAADLALKGTGMGDINTGMKVGDIAAKTPTRADPDAAQIAKANPGVLSTGFVTGAHEGYVRAARDPFKNRNMGIIGGGNKLPPVAGVSTRHYPAKGK